MRWFSIFAVIFFTFALTGCFEDDSATLRLKIIARALIDGKPVENSSVMEITWSHSSLNLIGKGGATYAKGEAVVLDLGQRGKVFILPWMNSPDGSFGQYYEVALPQSIGIKNRIAKFDSDDFAKLRNLKTGREFTPNYRFSMVDRDFKPFMVTLRDPADPATVTEVTKENFAKLFGEGASFKGVTIKITDEPVTSGVTMKALPLLKDRKRIWSQRPRNLARLQLPPMSERPLNWRMGPSLFFAFGNY